MDIRLVVNGTDLDLGQDFAIEREEETSLFNRELERKDFTYPANIPLTDSNNFAFGFISHLAVPVKSKEVTADLYFNGAYFNQVTIRVLSVSTVTQTIEISIIGTYGTFARIIGDRKLADLQLGGDRVIGTTSGSSINLGAVRYTKEIWGSNFFEATVIYYPCDSATHMKNVMTGATTADYFFYPAVDTKQNIENLNNGAKNLLNFYDWSTGEFADPIVEYFNTELVWRGLGQRLFWVPFFKTLYVLRKCFEECDFTVTGDIFSDPGMQRSTLYNTATFCNYRMHETEWVDAPVGDPGFYKTITVSNRSTIIHPQDHMPDMTILEFINELAKAWNLQYRIDLKMQTVQIFQIKDFKASAQVVDFSGRAFPNHEISFQENDLTDGYKFSFNQDPAETFLASKTKESLEKYPVVATVGTLAELTGSYTTFDLAFVRSRNAYYQYGGSDWFYYSWNALGLQTIPEAKNPVEISTKCCPVASDEHLLVRSFPDSGAIPALFEPKTLYMPTSNAGIKGYSLIWFKYPAWENLFVPEPMVGLINSEPVKIQPLMCYWRGMRPTVDAGAYPYGAAFNYDIFGTALQGGNHSWESPAHDGLFYNQWKGWTDILANAIPVKYDILFPGQAEDNYDYESCILVIHNQQYVLKKANKPMPYPNVSKFELIRL